MRHNREYSIIKLFLFARNIFFIGLIIGIISCFYGKSHLTYYTNREIANNYTDFYGTVVSYEIIESQTYHLNMYAINNQTTNESNTLCVYQDFYVGNLINVELTIGQNMGKPVKWFQKINTHECIGNLQIYYYTQPSNYYWIGVIFILLFSALQLLITPILIKKIMKYNNSTHEYLSKNTTVIIVLNMFKIIGVVVLLVNLLKNSNSEKHTIVSEYEHFTLETNSTGTNIVSEAVSEYDQWPLEINNTGTGTSTQMTKCIKYCSNNLFENWHKLLLVITSVICTCVSWILLIKHQFMILKICSEKTWSYVQISKSNEMSPFNIYTYGHPSYGYSQPSCVHEQNV